MGKDSIVKTFAVAAGLCIICSIIVSAAATTLKARQQENKELDKQLNVLRAAGLVEVRENPGSAKIKELFAKVDQVVVDINTGKTEEKADPAKINAKDASALTGTDDLAGIKSRPNKAVVYIVKGADKKPETIVLPIFGRGLWSTMYGFLALKGDLKTVANLTFYDHGETPGLGGEISNPSWTGKWSGKTALADSVDPVIRIIKGNVDPSDPNAAQKVDGISGATLTGNGVNHTIDFWLGKNGFGPWLKNLKNKES
ncbi:MAG: Na(+)-translocating NADH-quinone reductase subunit C [Planctomycetia bacterium]|nr:Na(+)-translocating NADH-quinone reductase subunit C [Planctomycetia bacterium]